MRYLISVLCMCCLACGPTPIFEESHQINQGNWSYDDGKEFSFVSPDTTNRYDLILDLLHSEDYAYENLYVQLTTVFPDKEQVADEISIPLIQDDGNWVGKGSSEKRVRVYLQQALKFKQLGEHTIILNQYSREEKLGGLHSVSLAIYPLGR